jgi:hypothetical protein
MSDEFEALQKYAIPSAENNPAGDMPLHQMTDLRGPRKLVTAEEAAANLASRRQAVKDAGRNDGKERLSLKLAAMHQSNPQLTAPPPRDLEPYAAEPEPTALANSYPKKRGKYQTGAQAPSKEKAFLSRRSQLTMGINGGIFKTPAIAVRETEFSVVALVPIGDGSSGFIPGPGSELEIQYDGKTSKVFYPGAYAEIPELGCGIMTFIKG